MAQRQNFGFNIGGGGIADLVKAPTITPARGFSFSPTPTIRREKDPDESLRGALLGALAPTGAKLGLAALAKVPGLERFLFKPDATKPLDITNIPQTGIYDSPAQAELSRRKAEIDKLLPSLKRPREKTAVGTALSELLTYAPAAFLDDDAPEGIDQFLKTATASKRVGADLDEAKLKAYLTRQTERGKKLIDVGDFDKKVSNSAVLQSDGTFKPFSREVLISKDGSTSYIKSRGENIDIQIDADGKEIKVPAGKYYTNPQYILRDEEPGQSAPVRLLDMNNDAMPYIGYTQFARTDKGRAVRILVADAKDNNNQITIQEHNRKYGTNLQLFEGPEYEALRARSKEQANPDLTKRYQGRGEKELALIEVANVATDLLDIAIDAEDNPELITTAGGLGTWYNSLYNNINSIFNLFEKDGFVSVDDVVRAKKNGQSALTLGKLLTASNNYSKVLSQVTPQNPLTNQVNAAQQDLVDALREVRDQAEDQGSFATWLNIPDADLDELVVKRGALAAGQLRLAYAAAAADGQTGTSLSDRDVANFLEQVGFGSQNALDIGTKISKFVKERLQTFDTGEFRTLSNASRRHEEQDIRFVNDYLVGTFRVDPADLDELKTVESGSVQEKQLVSKINRRIIRETDGAASSDFIYDSTNKRFRYKPVLERLQGYQSVYNRYKNKYWPKYKISEGEINLELAPDFDPYAPVSSEEIQVYTPRIRTVP